MTRRPRDRFSRFHWWLLAGAWLLVAALYLSGGLERVELILLDARYQQWPARQEPAIVIIAIDTPSLKELAQWPWPRSYHAELLDKLTSAGASVVGFDIDFSTQRVFEDDAVFIEAVRRSGRVVLGAFRQERMIGDLQVQYASLPFPELREAAVGVGSLSFPADLDGGIRRGLFDDHINGELFWNFGVELVRVAHGLSVQESAWAERDQFYNNFVGPAGSFPTFSYMDLLYDRVDSALLRDKIVLVGATSVELQDLWKAPFGGLMPGVEIEANVANAILTEQLLARIPPSVTLGLLLGITAGWGAVVFWVGRRRLRIARSMMVVVGTAVVLAAMILTLSVWLFRHHMILDTMPLLVQLLVMAMITGVVMNVRAGRSIEETTLSLAALHSVAGISQARQSLEDSIDFIFSMLQSILRIQILRVELRDPEGMDRKLTKGDTMWGCDTCGPWIQKTWLTRQSYHVADLPVLYTGRQGDGARRTASLFAPIMTHGKTLGVLHVHRTNLEPFQEEDLRMLYTVASQMAVIIEYEHSLAQMHELFLNTLEAFSSALDFRDNDTEGHSQRVTAYCLEIGKRLDLSTAELEVVKQGALLHDIGKIGIPDAILNKPGQLTEAEYEIMKQHAEYGFKMLKNIKSLHEASLIVYQHQERYDGQGYPLGLKGEEIVIGARIFAVADTYDAMTSDRCYRKGIADEPARRQIGQCSGTQFDPRVVEAFLTIPQERLETIRSEVEHLKQSSTHHTALFQKRVVTN